MASVPSLYHVHIIVLSSSLAALYSSTSPLWELMLRFLPLQQLVAVLSAFIIASIKTSKPSSRDDMVSLSLIQLFAS